MRKLQYKVLPSYLDSRDAGMLARLGEEGWRLVAVDESTSRLVFMREKREDMRLEDLLSRMGITTDIAVGWYHAYFHCDAEVDHDNLRAFLSWQYERAGG